MLICGSQRASESVLVDFVTAERVDIPPISTPGKKQKKNIEKLSQVEECFSGNTDSISKASERIKDDRIINSAYN